MLSYDVSIMLLVFIICFCVAALVAIFFSNRKEDCDKSYNIKNDKKCPLCGKPLKEFECDWEQRYEYTLTCDCGYTLTSSMSYMNDYGIDDINALKEMCKKTLDEITYKN